MSLYLLILYLMVQKILTIDFRCKNYLKNIKSTKTNNIFCYSVSISKSLNFSSDSISFYNIPTNLSQIRCRNKFSIISSQKKSPNSDSTAVYNLHGNRTLAYRRDISGKTLITSQSRFQSHVQFYFPDSAKFFTKEFHKNPKK